MKQIEDQLRIKYEAEPFYNDLTKYIIQKNVIDNLIDMFGDFVSFHKTELDKMHPNKIHQYINYSKLGLKITFIFYGKKIDGLWLSYYEL